MKKNTSINQLILKLSIIIIAIAVIAAPSLGQDSKQNSQGRLSEQSPREARINIDQVPNIPPGPIEMGLIRGTVSGISDKEGFKVVIYAYGDRWYVQPTEDEPMMDINSNGSWESQTHGGYRFAALLVKRTYRPRSPIYNLPSTGGDVIDIATREGYSRPRR